MAILEHLERYFLAGCMIATSLLLFANVMFRYFFQMPLFWAEEVLRYLIVWVTFVGMAVCIRENAHISLDLLLNALPENRRFLLGLLVRGIAFVGGLFLFWYSLRFTMRIYSTGQVSATIGGFPMYIVYSVMPVGFFLSTVHALRDMVKVLREHRVDAAHMGQGGE